MFEIGTATDYRDLLEKLDTFLTATGSAFGLTYAGTGDGTLTGYKGGTASVAETFEITATSATNFTVVGSVSGSQAAATVGTAYTGTLIQFTINDGGTDFVSGDVFVLNTAPPWTSRRHIRGALVTASGGTSGQYACENVIDGKTGSDTTRQWQGGAVPQTLQFDFPAALTIAEYAIMGASSANTYSPRTWTFEYWDGSAWQTLDTRTNITTWGAAEVKTFTITSPVSAARVRLYITAGCTPTDLRIQAVHLRIAAGGVDQAMSQYIWEAPGNDGLSAILVGAHAFQRTDVDYYDWELCAFTGYDAALPFYGQPGYHGRLWLPLLNSSIPYWFVADGRRVVVIAKVGSQYETGYLGFVEPYFTPAQVPYPIALGGSLALSSTAQYWNSVAYRHSNSSVQHKAFTHSDTQSQGAPANVYYAQARARDFSGNWQGYFSRTADGLTSAPVAGEGRIWPLSGGMTNLDTCIDGSYALFPTVLSDGTPNHLGQFSGISVLTGQGLSAETLIRIGAVDHLAVPNITRTDRDDFLAVRLD
jgi:hypothetical protein